MTPHNRFPATRRLILKGAGSVALAGLGVISFRPTTAFAAIERQSLAVGGAGLRVSRRYRKGCDHERPCERRQRQRPGRRVVGQGMVLAVMPGI